MSYFSTPRKKSISLKVGIIFLALSALGSVAAANITINKGARFEFGQTVYKVQACSGWVSISLTYGAGDASGPRAGDSRITGMTFSGIDPSKCLSTNLTFKFLGSSGTPLDLYSNNVDNVPPAPVNEVVLSVDANEMVSLLDSEGSYIGADGIGNDFVWLVNDESGTWVDSSAWKGEFFVYLTYPLAYMADLDRITVETGANGL